MTNLNLKLTGETNRSFANFEALMAEMAEGARLGARATLAAMPDARHWDILERRIDAIISERQRRFRGETIERESVATMGRTLGVIKTASAHRGAVEAYQTCASQIDTACRAWLNLATAETVARHVDAVIVWYSAWHLIGAGVSVAGIPDILMGPKVTQTLGSYGRPPGQARSPTPVASQQNGDSQESKPDQHAARSVSASLRDHMADFVNKGAGVLAAVNAKRESAARDESSLRTPEYSAQANASDQKMPSTAVGTLDGRALRTSVIGTWLFLVIASWFALFWGTALSIIVTGPFGVGLALISTVASGFIAVPLWGTVFGLLGMGAARDSTLRQMEFQELPEGHVLRSLAAHYAKQLDIPTPRLGTIAAHNAFAMGTDRNNATVALGRPLIETLSREELAAVLAHELGHVVSGDMRKMMLMRTFQNATVWFAVAQGLKQFARWVICWAAELGILAFSRRREYWADAIAAALAGKHAMIGALRKLDEAPALTDEERTHARFMFRGTVMSTHPPMSARIGALEQEKYIQKLPMVRARD